MQNANTLEAMEVARQLILVLKGTVESLQMNLSQERDDNEGLKLTIESLEDENARLQEELFKVQAGAVEEKDTAKENQAEAIEAIGEKLAFYYKCYDWHIERRVRSTETKLRFLIDEKGGISSGI